MAINLVIAVTDGDRFDMLRQQRNLGEVNFWAPSGASFRALHPGELFLAGFQAV
jgi:putative restriction endonuclease